MIKKIDHAVITTANPSNCIAFYERLGFSVRKMDERYELFAGDFKINVHILGKELLPHAVNIQHGSADFCFEISGNLTEFKKDLETKDFTIEFDVVQRTGIKGNMQSFYLRDPDGNLLEFCSYE